MGFHERQFPTVISYRSSGGPGFNTSIIEVDSGAEERVARWDGFRHQYDVAKGVQTYEQLTALKNFYIARGGAENGFRYKDWIDFHSSPTDSSFRSAQGTMDQLIGVGDGSDTQFQLIKNYTEGLQNKVRTIKKPVSGTVQIWVNSVLKTEGVDYTVDTTTGVVTFAVAPTNGHNIHASYQFDVPVRFSKQDDDWFEVNIASFGAGGMSINLVEEFDPDPSNTGDFPYRGARERSISANITITTGDGVFQVISASVGSLIVSLPDPTSIPHGAPIFYIENSGANTFTLKDHAAATLATMTAGSLVEVMLSKTSGDAKVWYVA